MRGRIVLHPLHYVPRATTVNMKRSLCNKNGLVKQNAKRGLFHNFLRTVKKPHNASQRNGGKVSPINLMHKKVGSVTWHPFLPSKLRMLKFLETFESHLISEIFYYPE